MLINKATQEQNLERSVLSTYMEDVSRIAMTVIQRDVQKLARASSRHVAATRSMLRETCDPDPPVVLEDDLGQNGNL